MLGRRQTLIIAACLVLATEGQAEVVRFRYAAANGCGNAVPVTVNGAPAQRAPWVGGVYEPYYRQVAPTHIVTFRHAYTGQNLNIPFVFPDGVPRVEHRADRVLYNYGTYQIQTHFVPDGTVEVIYNSGVLRPIAFQ